LSLGRCTGSTGTGASASRRFATSNSPAQGAPSGSRHHLGGWAISRVDGCGKKNEGWGRQARPTGPETGRCQPGSHQWAPIRGFFSRLGGTARRPHGCTAQPQSSAWCAPRGRSSHPPGGGGCPKRRTARRSLPARRRGAGGHGGARLEGRRINPGRSSRPRGPAWRRRAGFWKDKFVRWSPTYQGGRWSREAPPAARAPAGRVARLGPRMKRGTPSRRTGAARTISWRAVVKSTPRPTAW